MKDKAVVLKQWQHKAVLDLKAINILLKTKTAPRSIIAFHCQQAVEKYLKAFLFFNKIIFSNTHDLDLLLGLCLQKDNAFKLLNRSILTELKWYAVSQRYPGEEYEPNRKETEAYVKAVKQTKLLVEKLIK